MTSRPLSTASEVARPDEAAVVVSIIIATRDRCSALDTTLTRIAEAVAASPLPCEVLVADNGSSDDTHAVVSKWPWVRLVIEQNRGKSRALNAAIRSAAGGIMLFTDDDVAVPANWVECMTRPIRAGRAHVVVGSVQIPPCRLEALAGTLLEDRLAWVADTGYIDFNQPQAVVGANMAISRHVFDLIPGFDPDLGPGAPHTGFAEEALLLYQAKEAGFQVAGEPGAAVLHYFDVSRTDPDAIRQIAIKMARSAAYLNWHWMHTPWTVKPWTIPRMRLQRLWNRLRGRVSRSPLDHLDWLGRIEFQRAMRRLQNSPRRYPPPPSGIERTW